MYIISYSVYFVEISLIVFMKIYFVIGTLVDNGGISFIRDKLLITVKLIPLIPYGTRNNYDCVLCFESVNRDYNLLFLGLVGPSLF